MLVLLTILCTCIHPQLHALAQFPVTLSPSSSNLHSVSSLLVQQLLHQFSRAFLASPSDPMTSSRHHPGGLDQISLKEFLREDVTVFLLLSIHTINQQVRLGRKSCVGLLHCNGLVLQVGNVYYIHVVYRMVETKSHTCA